MTPWIVVPFTRPDFAENLSDNITRQTRPVRVCVVEVGEATRFACVALGVPADAVLRAPDGTHAGPARNLGVRFLQNTEPDAPVLFFDDDDYYGPSYVSDALAAMTANGATFTFQAVAWVRDEAGILWHTDAPRNTAEPMPVAGATIALERVSDCRPFPDTRLNEDASWGDSMRSAGLRGWCRDWRGFCYRRHGANTCPGPASDFAHRGSTVARVGPFDADYVNGVKSIDDLARSPCADYWFSRLSAGLATGTDS